MIYQLEYSDCGDLQQLTLQGPEGLDLKALEEKFNRRFPPLVWAIDFRGTKAEFHAAKAARDAVFKKQCFAEQFANWLCSEHGCFNVAKDLTIFSLNYN